MFPETYIYKQYAVTDTKSAMVRAAEIDGYTGTYSIAMAPPTYTEEGFVYGQKGLKY